MSLSSLLGISTASAATAAPAASTQGSMFSFLLPFALIIAVFYFLIVRPQSKRMKEQRQLMSNLALGDEVLTTSGIIGRLKKLSDGYVILTINKDIEMMFQKAAIASILPKGTMESL